MANKLAEQVIETLVKRKKTLCVAESCTGGRISAALTAVPGASKVFLGGVVSYSNLMKSDVLNVTHETLIAYGAVSRQVALEMALGALELTGADYAVSVTGIAGPDGGTPQKPVGLVYIGWTAAKETAAGGTTVERYEFPGNRVEVQAQAVERALAGMLELLDT